jgi:hypothetical protein
VNLWATVKPFLIGVGGVGLLVAGILLGGECNAWRGDHPKPEKPVAVVLPPTEGERKTKVVTEECVPVRVLVPTEKRAKQIAKETGGRAGAPVAAGPSQHPAPGEIGPQIASSEPDYPLLLVDGRPYPPSPEGGKLWVHLEMDGSTTVVALPNPEKPAPEEKFWSFRPVYEIGGMAGVGQEGDTRSRAWAAIEPARAGRIHLRVEGGLDIRDGASGAYGMIGAVWRSR